MRAGDGKIRVPADLDAVTATGEEDHSEIDGAAVDRIWRAARHWYRAGMHPAIQLCIRHHGRVVLNRAIGHGWGNAPTDEADAEKIPVTTDTPFCVYSAAKAITATVVHMLVERGHFALDDRVCEYLPSYTSHGKHRTTIRHVLTHSAGVPFPTGPRPDVRRADDHEYAVERLGELRPLYRPGLVHIYHALTWGPLMREIVYAATGKEIREILATEILDPLGFRWTNFGVAELDRELRGHQGIGGVCHHRDLEPVGVQLPGRGDVLRRAGAPRRHDANLAEFIGAAGGAAHADLDHLDIQVAVSARSSWAPRRSSRRRGDDSP